MESNNVASTKEHHRATVLEREPSLPSAPQPHGTVPQDQQTTHWTCYGVWTQAARAQSKQT